MNEFYYHLCPVHLDPGSVIKAGNWGRIVRSYPNVPGVNFWILFREQPFELIRQNHFFDKPSRYKCVFLFETPDNIEQFKRENARIYDMLYKVKIIDESKPIHKTCMKLTELAQNTIVLPQVEQQAVMYWEGNNIQSPEIITESDIEVLEVIGA